MYNAIDSKVPTVRAPVIRFCTHDSSFQPDPAKASLGWRLAVRVGHARDREFSSKAYTSYGFTCRGPHTRRAVRL